MSKFIERLFNYGKKLVEREKEKYSCGMKNDYYNYDDDFHSIQTAVYDNVELIAENAELKRKVKDLEDRLWGRSKL